ncbi:4-(cytidine 5'-diphospho)-2-C-methyl-D-erythritol kinase [Butyricicoccus sp.]|uniref:4-(cytidine 5'-diphospho)-2-C-methyl-D-erythritol kinase n=1 Tax=Butyricicoccus sp. TaxID=2049021 RepID=UPI003F137B08
MRQATVEAHAKINLTLDVTGKRPNGYHDVCMVMQSIGLHDTVTAAVGTGSGIRLAVEGSDLPADSSNLAYRAAELFLSETGTPCDGISIVIEKHIPVAAGLAGGSTDAAAVLVLLDELYDTRLGEKKLMEIGLKLGADVPFCISGGTMLAEGIGEVLTRLPDAPQTHVVLCKPPIAVSTPAIYRAIDSAEITERPDTQAMCAAIADRDCSRVAQLLCNVMQPVTAGMHPEVEEICGTLRARGAMGAIMSGSGPSNFGLFETLEEAQAACEVLAAQYPETYLTDFCTAAQVKR